MGNSSGVAVESFGFPAGSDIGGQLAEAGDEQEAELETLKIRGGG